MDKYVNVCYKNNFIKQVIFRIDFLRYVTPDVIFSNELENAIVKFYPQKGKDQIMRFNAINLVFDKNVSGIPSANGQSIEGLQKEYSTNNGNKVILSNMFVAFEINKYTIFDELMKCIKDILYILFKSGIVIAKRSGLRYINMFETNRFKLQKRYFNNDISSTLITKQTPKEESLCLIRSMHTNEYRIENAKLNFRYGMYNPEYPNCLRDNSFVLDYDCFSEEAFENADQILRFIEFAHGRIQELFESSISQSLRQVMDNE